MHRKLLNIIVGCVVLLVLCLLGATVGTIFGLFPSKTPTAVAENGGRAPQRTEPARAVNLPPTENPTATLAPEPSATATATEPTLYFPAILTVPITGEWPCIPPEAEITEAVVTNVVDGDTIEVQIGDQTFPLRYIGIDTPELSGQDEPFALEAADQNARLVAGQTVYLVKDVSETDRYDRLLRYVFTGVTFVNYELVRLGFASASSYPPDTGCDEAFQVAQVEARNAGVGIWSIQVQAPATEAPETRFNPPPVDTVPTQEPAQEPAPSGNCHKSYPTVCIPPPPPDLNCPDIPYRRFKVVGSDPHNFDGNDDGVGCESD